MQKTIIGGIIFLFMMVSADFSWAQIGRLKGLQKKVADKVLSHASNELDKSRDEFDNTSFNYAIALTDNAGLFENKEKGEDALKLGSNLLRPSQEQTEQERARSLLDMGEVLYAKRLYKPAEFYFTTARLSYESQGLTTDINYFTSIANLGLLYHNMGRYSTAMDYAVEALTLRKKNLGEDHAAYAASLNNLGVLEKDLGNYNKSEQILEESLDKHQKLGKGFEGPLALAYNNKAHLYQTMGRYQEAEPIMLQSLEIAEDVMDENSSSYLQLLTNLAFLYQDMGRYTEAENTYKRAIDIQESRLRIGRKSDPDYASMLRNLASLYMLMGQYDEVEELLTTAAEIYKNKFDENHPTYASAVSELGKYYRHMGRYPEAEKQFDQALQIRMRALGAKHPDFTESWEDLASVYWKTGREKEAADIYETVLGNTMDFVENYFPPMSETEKTRYWDKLAPRFQRYYSLVLDLAETQPQLVGDMMNYRLTTKALLLSSSNKVRQTILNSGDDKLIEDYTTWLDQKENLARLYSYSKEELREEKINLDSLERANNTLERALSERSSEFFSGYTTEKVTYQDVRKSLGSGEAAVEVIRVRYYDDKFSDKVKYGMVVIRPEDTGHPKLVVLENGTDLETRYFKFYRNAVMNRMDDDYSYDMFFAGLMPALKGKSRVYFSLDGIYNQISLATLRNSSNQYLINQMEISLVSNPREIIEYKDRKTATGNKSAFVLGDPDFGAPESIDPLPGTRVETSNIAQMLKGKGYQTSLHQGSAATEEVIKALKDYRIVHIATHGYFMEDVSQSGDQVFGISTDRAKNNPLLRSGLLLTGSGPSIAGTGTDGIIGDQNGILLAYEAMNLPLDKTEIVVLSACETGLGDIKAGEGVYGLQRAFLVAGADALIMSLWKVSDEATQQLMRDFYNGWLTSGDKRKAFRDAQLNLQKKFPQPYYWGAFQMIGG